MMGVQEAPARLFYDFCLDEHVPSDHLLRGIDRHLDLADLRQSLKPFCSSMGRPSIDPELMMRMLIVGYCMGIRSEQRLCEEVHLNLAYRWFCRLGLDGKVPDHSTFSKNRHGRFRESDALRRLFESVVERCMEEGLVGAEGFAVDASLIAADANKQRSVPSKDWKPEEFKEDAGPVSTSARPVTPAALRKAERLARPTKPNVTRAHVPGSGTSACVTTRSSAEEAMNCSAKASSLGQIHASAPPDEQAWPRKSKAVKSPLALPKSMISKRSPTARTRCTKIEEVIASAPSS